jgi:hypothetical protein
LLSRFIAVAPPSSLRCEEPIRRSMLECIHEFGRGGSDRELKACGRVLNARCNKRVDLSLRGLKRMSPILPISFLVTVLCAFGAVEGMLFQQLMFVGAALSATILVCSFEAWSAREIPVRGNDETRHRNPSDY